VLLVRALLTLLNSAGTGTLYLALVMPDIVYNSEMQLCLIQIRVPVSVGRTRVSPGPRLRLLKPVSRLVCGFGVSDSASLCIALLCGVFVRLRPALFPAGGPFLPSLSVNLYKYTIQIKQTIHANRAFRSMCIWKDHSNQSMCNATFYRMPELRIAYMPPCRRFCRNKCTIPATCYYKRLHCVFDFSLR
jgi:hypothetical protein